MDREKLINELNKEFKKGLSKAEDIEHTYDEATGTYYCLTGEDKIPERIVKEADDFFRREFAKNTGSKDTFKTALYCSIAIEAIAHFMATSDPKKINIIGKE